jgi:cytochrome c biogenesis protein CcmG/thiol:disulfide interchange protein DsbE
MLRYVLPVAVFGALVAFFYFGLGRDKETLPSPLIGKPAPVFELPRVDNPSVKVSNREFAGRMYAVNVWGSWCVGCRQEHEALMQIASRGDVPIIGLNWNDQLDAAQRWLRELGDPYVYSAFDNEGRAAIDLGVYGAPETFLVDRDGRIVHKYVGPLTLATWEDEFVPLIAARSGAPAGAARE